MVSGVDGITANNPYGVWERFLPLCLKNRGKETLRRFVTIVSNVLSK